jgi:hypothetical protein
MTNMKQMILSVVILLGVLSTTEAQSNTHKKRTQTSSARKTTRKAATPRTIDTTNNRVEYKSRKTGQAATITGQEATGTNGQQSANPKNAGKKDE